MNTRRAHSGLLAMMLLIAGCASTKAAHQGPTEVERLRHEVTQLQAHVGNLEVNLNGVETAQQDIRDELRTLRGLYEGLREPSAPGGEPDGK